MSDTMPGGWTPYSTKISAKEAEVFKAATHGLLGVSYHPIAVASQVVAGVNYKYFCNAKVVYPNAPNIAVVILIYAPLQGDPHVVTIEKV